MGLDMYLRKKIYIGNNYKEPKDQVKIDVPGVKQERVQSITENIGYWRKANAIHAWFVENIQNGEDNCQESWVSAEDLQTLLNIVNEVLESCELIEGEVHNGYTFDSNGNKTINLIKGKIVKDPSIAQKLLPVQEGFFFGSDQYDEYYVEDLKDTKKILEEALKESENGEIYYQASW